jgi:hypothetical protein
MGVRFLQQKEYTLSITSFFKLERKRIFYRFTLKRDKLTR